MSQASCEDRLTQAPLVIAQGGFGGGAVVVVVGVLVAEGDGSGAATGSGVVPLAVAHPTAPDMINPRRAATANFVRIRRPPSAVRRSPP
jgi:hypothetical protein